MNFLFELFKTIIFIMFPLIFFKSVEEIIKSEYISKIAIILSFLISLYCSKNIYLILFSSLHLGICLLKKDKVLYFILTAVLFNYCYIHSLPYLFLESILLFPLIFIKKESYRPFTLISIYFYSLTIFKYNINISYFIITIVFFFLIEIYINKVYIINFSKKINELYSGYLFKFIHEVKNPLSVVSGYLEIITKKEEFDINKYISIINKEIKESLNIIEDYLMYGRLNVNFDYIDINMLLKDVSDDFKKLENVYDMELNFYYDEEEIIVLGDYSKLKQVFVNIIKNSIESHSEKKLEIDIDYKIVKNNIVIDINDNGVGIKDSSLVGKEYYTTKKNGTGLGVNFSKNIISLHKGNIKYTANNYLGTNVKISLPVVNILN